ncbi:MAG: hypothetical protein H0W47_03320 [Polaromonas sp.]|uniref:hypothetical protein n=1 Tax=Polaromonas sp. TaxID=1869339 RepID=UPI001859BB3F|nr:hypothetical protein [Polaromonas sp.]MBA3592815.1 hypothetical protein [Polaromonas sp.]
MLSAEPSQLDAVLKGLGMGCAAIALILPGQVTSRQAQQPAAAPVAVLATSLDYLPRTADFAHEQASDQAREMADWVMDSRDHRGMPFVIVDKPYVRVFVFKPDGTLDGASVALMGSATGDDSVEGIGEREMSAIAPHERTTPAGRFVSQPGINAFGEDIIWVDYEAAVSMHRVRAKEPSERRLERLASATTDDNRISFGCINLPVAFYEDVVKPALGSRRGVIYILPETRPAQAVFQGFRPSRS